MTLDKDKEKNNITLTTNSEEINTDFFVTTLIKDSPIAGPIHDLNMEILALIKRNPSLDFLRANAQELELSNVANYFFTGEKINTGNLSNTLEKVTYKEINSKYNLNLVN